MYEFANLPPGSHRVMVEHGRGMRTQTNPRRFNLPAASPDVNASLDPSLDVTYQLTWFQELAMPCRLRRWPCARETSQSGFSSVPIPAIHLRIVPRQRTECTRTAPIFPVLERMDVGVPGDGLAQNITTLAARTN